VKNHAVDTLRAHLSEPALPLCLSHVVPCATAAGYSGRLHERNSDKTERVRSDSGCQKTGTSPRSPRLKVHSCHVVAILGWVTTIWLRRCGANQSRNGSREQEWTDLKIISPVLCAPPSLAQSGDAPIPWKPFPLRSIIAATSISFIHLVLPRHEKGTPLSPGTFSYLQIEPVCTLWNRKI
jgi:hypothetical protein